ncbi:hypothetical protein [uncultured Selenomonas sp.]|uniref:hypothetical protein n=1 Tax=uncultured Selenomonas sp. TaxID=159275 RepID=UPI0025828107|nr:hypothetical protein [uncultured Selenomonas sp.]
MGEKQIPAERLRDDVMCRKVAVWLCNHSLKNVSYYVQECYEELKEYAAGALPVRMLQGIQEGRQNASIGKEQARELLDGEIAEACRQIDLWEAQPGDTNARFFRMKYQQVNWDA